MTDGSSQRAARGCGSGTKTKSEKTAAAQIAARVQRKISGAGFRARGGRDWELRPRLTYSLTGGHGAR